MGKRWALALAVAGVAASAGASAPGGAPGAAATDEPAPSADVCERGRVDRARTPSRACLSCHDGAAGTAVGLSVGTGRTDHPVGVEYDAVSARRPGMFAPSGDIPPSVPLVNGKIECTTCHDGASASRVADRSQLCTACHRL